MEYVYILHEREFIRLKENTYKIGRTATGPFARFKGYPKGSKLLFLHNVKDAKPIENQIKKAFKYKYEQMKEYGSEYFRGDLSEMIDDVRTIIKQDQDDCSVDSSSVIQFMTEFTCQCIDKNIAISTNVLYKHYRSWSEKIHKHAVHISVFANTIESILPRVSDNVWALDISMLKLRLIEISGHKDLFSELIVYYNSVIERFREYLRESNISYDSDHLFSLYKMWRRKNDPVFYKAYFNKRMRHFKQANEFMLISNPSLDVSSTV